MDKPKAYEDAANRTPQELTEDLNKIGDGQASDPLFIDAPKTKVQLDLIAVNLINSHKTKNGTPVQKEQYKLDHQAAIDAVNEMARYANFKCAGIAALYAKLGVRYYDASGKGGQSSGFSLEQGPNSGQVWITVPRVQPRESYIAMYSLEESTPLSECSLAGGSTSCGFLLNNLPPNTRVFIRWATITGAGIGAWSEPYPFLVR